MSEKSADEKTEQPSPKKIRDARAKGQVARSQEVVTTVSLIATVATIWVSWAYAMPKFIRLIDEVARLQKGDFRVNAFNAIALMFHDCSEIMLPILATVIIAGVTANYIQIGAIFALDALAPQLNRISPGAGFKRIFSMKQLIETLKSLLKIIFLSIVLYVVVIYSIGPYVNSLSCGLPCQTEITLDILRQLLLLSALAFVVVAILDFMYQRRSYTKSLMMTKQEVKRENKEAEGDPHIKAQRKQLAQELIMGDVGQRARDATAVIVNPTHLAIALKFDVGWTPLPVVTAKAAGHRAHFLRTEAERSGVPIFRNVKLARGLHAVVEIDQFVPEEFFGAVAEVLAWVEKNRPLLYAGLPLDHGVIDMEARDHLIQR
jgi:type III secretion protein U